MRIICPVELTDKEQAFIRAIALDGCVPTTAATRSGHAMSTARLLLSKPHVQAALHYVATNCVAAIGKWEKREAKRAAKGKAA